MTAGPVFTSRLTGRQLLDGDGLAIGRVRDVVILPAAGGDPPWVLGLVVTLQRRQIFVNLGRVERDHEVAARTRADTEFLARELAAVRLALVDVVTTADLDGRLSQLEKLLVDRQPHVALPEPAPARSGNGEAG